jgi:hypothetical protein
MITDTPSAMQICGLMRDHHWVNQWGNELTQFYGAFAYAIAGRTLDGAEAAVIFKSLLSQYPPAFVEHVERNLADITDCTSDKKWNAALEAEYGREVAAQAYKVCRLYAVSPVCQYLATYTSGFAKASGAIREDLLGFLRSKKDVEWKFKRNPSSEAPVAITATDGQTEYLFIVV